MRGLALLTGAATLSLCVTAAAQDASTKPDDANFQAIQAAKTLFDQGQKQMAAKNYAAACASFKASNDAVARVGTLLNLADCYEKAGKLASAWGAYFDSINLGRRQGHPEYEEFAQKKKDELEPKLVKLTIDVPLASRVDGMKVTRDGTLVEAVAWGVPIAVDPGKHAVDVTAPGKLAYHTDVEVDEAHKMVDVTVPKLEDAPVATARPAQPEVVERVVQVPSMWTPVRVGGVAVGSAGVLSVVFGSVLGLVANARYHNALDTYCTNGDPNACKPQGVADGASAHDLAAVSTGLFVGGLIATAAGVTLFFVGAPRKPRTVGLRVSPTFGGASAVLSGSF